MHVLDALLVWNCEIHARVGCSHPLYDRAGTIDVWFQAVKENVVKDSDSDHCAVIFWVWVLQIILGIAQKVPRGTFTTCYYDYMSQIINDYMSRVINDYMSRVINDYMSRVINDYMSRVINDYMSRVINDYMSRVIREGTLPIVSSNKHEYAAPWNILYSFTTGAQYQGSTVLLLTITHS
jgi:hypothetical protein